MSTEIVDTCDSCAEPLTDEDATLCPGGCCEWICEGCGICERPECHRQVGPEDDFDADAYYREKYGDE